MFIKPLAAFIAASVMLTHLTTFSATSSSTEKASKPAAKAAKSSSKSPAKTAKKPAAPQEVAELELAHGLDEAAAVRGHRRLPPALLPQERLSARVWGLSRVPRRPWQ